MLCSRHQAATDETRPTRAGSAVRWMASRKWYLGFELCIVPRERLAMSRCSRLHRLPTRSNRSG